MSGYPVVIPVAGRGSRIDRFTRFVAKELLPLGDDVVLSHILGEIQAAGLRDVILVSRPEKTDIAAYVEHVERERRFDLRVRVIHQGAIPGNGGAILSAAALTGKRPFLVVWGDEVFLGPSRITQLISGYETLGAPSVCLTEVTDLDVPTCGIAEGTWDHRGYLEVRRILEKPRPTATASRWASVGGFVIDPPLVRSLAELRPGPDGEVYLSAALDRAARTRPLFGVPIEARWYETGSYAGYARAFCALAHAQDLG